MQICVDPLADPWRLPRGPWSFLLPLPPRLLLLGSSEARLWPATPCGPSLPPELKLCVNLVPILGGLLGQTDSGEVIIWRLNGSVLDKEFQLPSPGVRIEKNSLAISQDRHEVTILSGSQLLIWTKSMGEGAWQKVELPYPRLHANTIVWEERRKGWVISLVLDQDDEEEMLVSILTYSQLRGLEEMGRHILEVGEKGTLCQLAGDGRLALVVTSTRILILSTATGKIITSYISPCAVVSASWVLSATLIILLDERGRIKMFSPLLQPLLLSYQGYLHSALSARVVSLFVSPLC